MSKIIDPVFSPEALGEDAIPDALGIHSLPDDFDLDELAKDILGLEGRVDKNPRSAAIILAGGSGERFGVSEGKQLVEIAGKPILTWSAEAFDAVGDIGLIVIVCPEDRQEEYLKKAIDPFPFVTPVTVAPSGPSRQESAFSGLEYVPDDYDYVVLHDGARPLITPDLIAHTIATVKGNIDSDGAVVAHPAIDTLKVVENGVIVGTPDRSVFWNAQTPQVFRAGIYRRAHAAALSDGFVGTDDSSLIERLGGKVLVVEGRRDNIKLTVPEDFLLLVAAVRAKIALNRKENKERG
ncbi:MAG: 2-C-methyl-D-erythritol 4-phosphate cytidylyltransferase [Eggerthellaceae bacterium]|jgi:2-C-methyl-D-erythritol 4-phosphate cytidylyltransferase